MRITVMGAGGVGGYYGGMLARAGNEVTFVARGAHLEALRARGLELRTQGETHRVAVRAVADPGEAGPMDLALFTVKTYDTATALDALAPAIAGDAAVLTLQNGVESVDQLTARLGASRVLAGVTYVAAGIAEPGIVAENGFSRKIAFGEPGGGSSSRVEAIFAVMKAAGLDVELSTNARQAIWDKFVLVAPHATISALCQTPIGITRETPEAMALYHSMVGEVAAVGRAAGFTIPQDEPDRIVANFMGAPPGQTSSLQRDYANKRRVELEYLPGSVVRLAKQHGVAVPRFEALYAVLKVQARQF